MSKSRKSGRGFGVLVLLIISGFLFSDAHDLISVFGNQNFGDEADRESNTKRPPKILLSEKMHPPPVVQKEPTITGADEHQHEKAFSVNQPSVPAHHQQELTNSKASKQRINEPSPSPNGGENDSNRPSNDAQAERSASKPIPFVQVFPEIDMPSITCKMNDNNGKGKPYCYLEVTTGCPFSPPNQHHPVKASTESAPKEGQGGIQKRDVPSSATEPLEEKAKLSPKKTLLTSGKLEDGVSGKDETSPQNNPGNKKGEKPKGKDPPVNSESVGITTERSGGEPETHKDQEKPSPKQQNAAEKIVVEQRLYSDKATEEDHGNLKKEEDTNYQWNEKKPFETREEQPKPSKKPAVTLAEEQSQGRPGEDEHLRGQDKNSNQTTTPADTISSTTTVTTKADTEEILEAYEERRNKSGRLIIRPRSHLPAADTNESSLSNASVTNAPEYNKVMNKNASSDVSVSNTTEAHTIVEKDASSESSVINVLKSHTTVDKNPLPPSANGSVINATTESEDLNSLLWQQSQKDSDESSHNQNETFQPLSRGAHDEISDQLNVTQQSQTTESNPSASLKSVSSNPTNRSAAVETLYNNTMSTLGWFFGMLKPSQEAENQNGTQQVADDPEASNQTVSVDLAEIVSESSAVSDEQETSNTSQRPYPSQFSDQLSESVSDSPVSSTEKYLEKEPDVNHTNEIEKAGDKKAETLPTTIGSKGDGIEEAVTLATSTKKTGTAVHEGATNQPQKTGTAVHEGVTNQPQKTGTTVRERVTHQLQKTEMITDQNHQQSTTLNPNTSSSQRNAATPDPDSNESTQRLNIDQTLVHSNDEQNPHVPIHTSTKQPKTSDPENGNRINFEQPLSNDEQSPHVPTHNNDAKQPKTSDSDTNGNSHHGASQAGQNSVINNQDSSHVPSHYRISRPLASGLSSENNIYHPAHSDNNHKNDENPHVPSHNRDPNRELHISHRPDHLHRHHHPNLTEVLHLLEEKTHLPGGGGGGGQQQGNEIQTKPEKSSQTDQKSSEQRANEVDETEVDGPAKIRNPAENSKIKPAPKVLSVTATGTDDSSIQDAEQHRSSSIQESISPKGHGSQTPANPKTPATLVALPKTQTSHSSTRTIKHNNQPDVSGRDVYTR